jgi:hypothetical protein
MDGYRRVAGADISFGLVDHFADVSGSKSNVF